MSASVIPVPSNCSAPSGNSVTAYPAVFTICGCVGAIGVGATGI